MYALLVAVGDYSKMNTKSLPSFGMDIALMSNALISGLKFPKENVFVCGKDAAQGIVGMKEFAFAMAKISKIVAEDDLVLVYFSGHGDPQKIVFSDGIMPLQSVIDYVSNMGAKSKIVVLDCCYSGGFQAEGPAVMDMSDTADAFAGKGITVLASCGQDEISRLELLEENGKHVKAHSHFTGMITSSMMNEKLIKMGKVSIYDIFDDVRLTMECFNGIYPDRMQQPVYRASIGGTIFFRIAENNTYKPLEVAYTTDEYDVVEVKPLSSNEMKRLAAFVRVKHIPTDEMQENQLLAKWTKEIANRIKREKVFSSGKSFRLFRGKQAKVVWCYFGYDESDMVNHLYFAITTWAENKEIRDKFCRSKKSAVIIDDIYIDTNTSYQMLRKMQDDSRNEVSRSEFIQECKTMLSVIVTMGEAFIYSMNELLNRTVSFSQVKKQYETWLRQVKKQYIKMTDLPIAPDDLHSWSEEILDLAGWIVDMAILLEKPMEENVFDANSRYLIQMSVKRYHQSLENLKVLEKDVAE